MFLKSWDRALQVGAIFRTQSATFLYPKCYGRWPLHLLNTKLQIQVLSFWHNDYIITIGEISTWSRIPMLTWFLTALPGTDMLLFCILNATEDDISSVSYWIPNSESKFYHLCHNAIWAKITNWSWMPMSTCFLNALPGIDLLLFCILNASNLWVLESEN